MNQNVFFQKSLDADLARFFQEDDLDRNLFYLNSLPSDLVNCSLKLKSDMVLSGLPFFCAAFNYLGADIDYKQFVQYEGQMFLANQKKIIEFSLPFNIALSGERIALNLLQRSSAISTLTNKFVEKSKKYNIKILDTRKTTPGLRSVEKYAVRVGGGYNHRLGQADVWMIKDNHKDFFGGLKGAWNFFSSQQTFYNSIVAEVHNISELKEAFELGIQHVMLDNFSKEMLNEAVVIKEEQKNKFFKKMTYEISGGVKLENVNDFLIQGIDAISIGALTHSAPHVDISLKYKRT